MHVTNLNREEMIRSHLSLARHIARKFARRVPSSVREDVEGAAFLGLTEAAGRFDESRPGAFVAFASRRIRGAIQDELRHHDPLTRRTRSRVKKLEKATSHLRARLGRAPTSLELQAELDLTPRELDCQRQTAAVVRVELEDNECRDRAKSPAQLAALEETKASLVAALAVLRERELTILHLSYQEELSLREIGERLGVSESRVCQLRNRALSRLREELDNK